MKVEIERKFLVQSDNWRSRVPGEHCLQGYLSTDKEVTVRVRVIGEKGFLTIKGKTEHFTRPEYEYEIPGSDAHEMLLTLCAQPLIEKIRYRIKENDAVWTVDEFLGENKGLLLAEIELNSEEEVFVLPPWVGMEVTGDHRYFNVQLVKSPFSQWGKKS